MLYRDSYYVFKGLECSVRNMISSLPLCYMQQVGILMWMKTTQEFLEKPELSLHFSWEAHEKAGIVTQNIYYSIFIIQYPLMCSLLIISQILFHCFWTDLNTFVVCAEPSLAPFPNLRFLALPNPEPLFLAGDTAYAQSSAGRRSGDDL